MAEPNVKSHKTDPNKTYILKSLNATASQAPAEVLFHCFYDDQLLGSTLLSVSDRLDQELLDFWKPQLETVHSGNMITLLVRGGRFSYTELSKGSNSEEQGGWVSYAPLAIQPELSDIKVQ